MTKHPGLAATQVGRICYEIVRVLNEVPDKDAREHALGLLIATEGTSRYRAEVVGHVFYGRTPEEAEDAARMLVEANGRSIPRPSVQVAAL